MSDQKVERTKPLKEQIARIIANQIYSGEIRKGEALPSTRQLAERHGVSLYTVNDAMKRLEVQGLVEAESRSKRVVTWAGAESGSPLDLVSAIFIGGYAGSGKSEFGKILSQRTGSTLLDKDTLTRPMVEVLLTALGSQPHDRESATYLEKVRPVEYESLVNTVLEVTDLGISTVVAAPFIAEFKDRSWVDRTTELIASHNATPVFVWVDCDVDSMKAYLRQRGASRDDYKLSHWQEYVASLEVPFQPEGWEPHMVYNSMKSPDLSMQAQHLIDEIAAASQ